MVFPHRLMRPSRPRPLLLWIPGHSSNRCRLTALKSILLLFAVVFLVAMVLNPIIASLKEDASVVVWYCLLNVRIAPPKRLYLGLHAVPSFGVCRIS